MELLINIPYPLYLFWEISHESHLLISDIMITIRIIRKINSILQLQVGMLGVFCLYHMLGPLGMFCTLVPFNCLGISGQLI